MGGARHFEELDCWKLSQQVKVSIYALLERPIIARDYDFCRDFKDAAASPPRNIAEGFGRRTHADFARFLDIARASLNECQNHLRDAVDRRYIAESERCELDALARRALGAVAALQRYLRGGSN